MHTDSSKPSVNTVLLELFSQQALHTSLAPRRYVDAVRVCCLSASQVLRTQARNSMLTLTKVSLDSID